MNSNGFLPMEEAEWAMFQNNLVDYVRLELLGEAVEEIYPEISFYIDTIPACEDAYYQEFRSQGLTKSASELQQLGQSDMFRETLQQIVFRASPEWIPAVATDWVEVALDYGRGWLEQETARWRQLLVHLSPAQVGDERLATATSGLMGNEIDFNNTDSYQWQIAPKGANFVLHVILSLEPVPEQKDRCRLDITVTLRDRFGDFSGVDVILSWADVQQKRTTDPLGKVSFTGVPCDISSAMSLVVQLPA